MTWSKTQDYLCELLQDKGFWVYQTINKPSGQPVDVIASRDNKTYIFEVKHCSNDYFQLSRVEDNQIMSIERYNQCGNGNAYFTLYYEKHKQLIILDSDYVINLIGKQSSIKYENAIKHSIEI